MGKGSKARKRLVAREKYFDAYNNLYRKDCDICEGVGEIENELIGSIDCIKCNGWGKIPKNE